MIRRLLGGVLIIGIIAALIAVTPRLLRRLDLFRVERVEVLGTRYLAPHLVLEVSGITSSSNLFDDPAPWREAILEHPLVGGLVIEREYPGTLILRVDEVEPVALIGTPILRPVDARGHLLPIEPASVDLDLPVISVDSGADSAGRLIDGEALRLIGALERLDQVAPWLAARTSALAPHEGGGLQLLLREPVGGEAILPDDFNVLRIEQLRLTMADLDARQELSRLRRIDVRYRDQVVVSLTSG